MIRALLLVVLLTVPASADDATHNVRETARDPLIEEGLAAMYNLDFDITRRNAHAFIRKNPNNPLGHLFMAGTLWWEATTMGAVGEIDDKILVLFHASVERTTEISKPLYESEDISERTDGLYAAGMALGIQGQMRLSQGQYFRAYRSGKKAINFLKKCAKKDPRYYDVYFGLGLFDYQVAVLPGAIKLGAKFLMKGTGDAKRGLNRIQMTIKKGVLMPRQAAGLMLSIYILNEKDYPRALALSDKILLDFPDSPYFKSAHIQMLHRTGHNAESYREAYELFKVLKSDPKNFHRKHAGTLCGFYGAECLQEELLQTTVEWLTPAIVAAETGSDSDWTAHLYLYRGLIQDILGLRARALSDYARVLQLPAFYGSQHWAKRCTATPCSKTEAVRILTGA